MSKHQRREERAVTIWPHEWRDAEARLGLMEEASRRAIRAGGTVGMRIVPPQQPMPPVLLPARFAGVLYGPDGKPIQEMP